MSRKKKYKTMNLVLIFIAIILLSFTAVMIWLYYRTGGVPDVLIGAVFGTCSFECGAMGWIKTTKEKERNVDLEKEMIKYRVRFKEDVAGKLDEIMGEETI